MYQVSALSPASQVNFGQRREYIPEEYCDYEDSPNDDYQSRASIEQARDAEISQLRGTQNDFNELANSLESNGNNKITKGLSKGAKIGASLIGLAVTYTTAKYGSKVTLNILKDIVKSPTIQKGVESVKSSIGEIAKIKDTKAVQSMITGLKNSSIGRKAAEVLNKPSVKEVLSAATKGKKAVAETLKKHITGDKIQTAIENTLAASTTASVLIDDLAGRNDDKSMMSVAMGASGGDK